jgi:hypothetical protein
MQVQKDFEKISQELRSNVSKFADNTFDYYHDHHTSKDNGLNVGHYEEDDKEECLTHKPYFEPHYLQSLD